MGTKIGVFDSGVGGTTVLKRIKDILPDENIIYYGDTLFSPYGEKTKEQILERCIKISEFLVSEGCKAIVIACNTATVAAINELKELMEVPIIGVINPGARGTVSATKSKRVGVLATPFTVKNLAYTKEIKLLDDNVEIFESGCKLFCTMIEKGWDSFQDRLEIAKGYLDVLPKDIDTLVLGCTHYPMITKDIEKLFHGKIIDPAFETAKEIKKILEEKEILSKGSTKEETIYYVSGDKDMFKEIVESFLNEKLNIVINKVV